jgi:hypothetical protein
MDVRRTSLLEPTRIMPFPASQVENGPTLEIADESEKAEALHEIAKRQQFRIPVFVGDLIVFLSDLAIGSTHHPRLPSNAADVPRAILGQDSASRKTVATVSGRSGTTFEPQCRLLILLLQLHAG